MFEEDYHKKNKMKRENKRIQDKKKNPVYIAKHSDVLEERSHKGFVLQLVQNTGGSYKVTSPYFKKNLFAMQRKTIESAFKQGEYLVHCIYNYEDVRQEFLNEEGLNMVLSGKYHSCQPWEEECICEEKN